jgi:hypothetical protein
MHAYALLTGDKMLSWGYQGETKCMFCRYGVEDRDHLFFFFFFAAVIVREIWWSIMQLCDLANPPVCWEAYVCRLTFEATIYHIWRNRNALRHSNFPLYEDQLRQKIK